MKKFIIILISCLLVTFLGAHIFNRLYHKNIRSHPQMYCYDDLRDDHYIPALYISWLSDKDEYLDYNKKIERGEDPYFYFPLKAVPFNKSVYVLDTLEEDSNIIKIYFYCKENRYFTCNTSCYVYKKFLHKEKAPRCDMK